MDKLTRVVGSGCSTASENADTKKGVGRVMTLRQKRETEIREEGKEKGRR